MTQHLRPALVSLLLFTALLGLIYPLAVTGVAQLVFPAQANGSLVRAGDRVVGSALIGQGFAGEPYLHSRPSAAGGNGYDGSASSGSNLGPLNPDLAKRIAEQAEAIRAAAPGATIPADAVTASGSGLDPDISPAYARLQAPRVASARGVSPAQVEEVIAQNTRSPLLGFVGQARVNVLLANLALDARYPAKQTPPK